MLATRIRGDTIRPMLSRVSVRVLLPLLLVLPVAVSATALIWIGSSQSRSSVRALTYQEMRQIHGRIQERLDQVLRTPPRISAINAALVREGRLDPLRPRSWRRTLFAQTHALETLSGITWANADGHVAWMFRYPGKAHYEFGIRDAQTVPMILEFAVDAGGEIIEQVGGYEFDPATRPWHVGAMASDEPTYLAPYAWVNADGSEVTLGLPFVERVEDASGVLGVLSTEMSLDDLSQFLQSLRVGDRGFVMILDAGGHLIANSLGAPIATDDLTMLPATMSTDERLVGAARAALASHAAELEAEVGGEATLLHVAPYAGPGLDWRIVTGVPVAELLAPVQEGRRRAMVTTGTAVLITLLIGVGLGVLATRPISRLVNDVKRIGEGELEHTVGATASSELATLSRAINEMTVDLRDRVRLRESLQVAMEVQSNLLPSGSPTIAGLDIAGHSTYCDETGGDYYDYLQIEGLGENTAALVIGDVMGHGVAAAMLMATARGILRSRCDEPGSLGELLDHLNDLLVADTGGQRFMTMLLVTLNANSRALTWASAGHDPAFLFSRARGEFVELDGGGIPLGIMGDERYEEFQYPGLGSGDILVLATDGLWEARAPGGEMYGKDRLKDVIRQHAADSAQRIGEAMREAHARFCGEESQADDITFVVAKIV
jgi:sigma-B regulation protein RsbU (phosphoserine phosphatase)